MVPTLPSQPFLYPARLPADRPAPAIFLPSSWVLSELLPILPTTCPFLIHSFPSKPGLVTTLPFQKLLLAPFYLQNQDRA